MLPYCTVDSILRSSNNAQTPRIKRRENNNNNNKGTSFYTLLLSSNTPNVVQQHVDICNAHIRIYKIVTETQLTVLYYLSIYTKTDFNAQTIL